jgi:hypothetical protein
MATDPEGTPDMPVGLQSLRVRGGRGGGGMMRSCRIWLPAVLAGFAIMALAAPQRAGAQCSLPAREPCVLVEDDAAPPPPPDRGKLANRLDEIGPLMSKCLQMPPYDIARAEMRVTVRLSFTRSGEILGEPRFTFITPGVPSEIRAAYQRVAIDMLNRCTPLPITPELGGAIAGRPFVFVIVETRKEKKAENSNERNS